MIAKRLLPLMGAVLLVLSGCAATDTPSATTPPQASTTAPAPGMGQSPTIQDTIVTPEETAAGANTTDTAGAADWKDGVYTARTSDEYTQATGHGWQEYLTITVENGEIVQLDYDAVQNGKLKSETTPDTYPMTPHPSQWIPQLEANLMKATSPETIDAVTGATNSSQMVRKLYAAVTEAAQEGTDGDIIVE